MSSTTKLNPAAEAMIEKYSEWLNNFPPMFGEKFKVTRGDYDLWDDPPRVTIDKEVESMHLYGLRIIVMNVSPFHDEGGHAHLIGTFHQYADEEWILNNLVAEFDASLSVVVNDQQLVKVDG